MKPWQRRLLTRCVALCPALAVTIAAGDRGAGRLLILSQVVLSLQLGFAVVPLCISSAIAAEPGCSRCRTHGGPSHG